MHAGGRVTRTFAFLDLSGFDDHATFYGEVRAVAELHRLRAAVRTVASRWGVRIDKWLGSGVMIVGTVGAELVSAVMGIVDRVQAGGSLQVRAGIATGEVLFFEGGDYIGATVNLAARLCDLAEAGEVLAARHELQLPADVRLAAGRTRHIRGVVEPVTFGSLAMA